MNNRITKQVFRFRWSLFLVSLLARMIMVVSAASSSSSFQNVYGGTLQTCSTDGMALTGFTRTGYCVDENDDEGSHHICLDIASTNNDDETNFCTVTGQSDWCSYEEMPCHEDSTQSACPVEQWCVCQWAFASYLESLGGCDQLPTTLVCEAINLQAVLAYQSQSSTSKYQNALDCLVDRCGLDLSNSKISSSSSSSSSTARGKFRRVVGGMTGSWILAVMTALVLIVGVAIRYHQRQKERGNNSTENNKTEPFVASYGTAA